MKLFRQYRGLRKELYILFIGRVMTNLGSMIQAMFTLILNKKLGLDAGAVAFFMMIYTVASIPIILIGGKLADKFNKKYIIVICDSISIAAYFYCAFVPVTVSSVIIFSIASLLQSAEMPSYDALVADFTTSRDRERAFSLSYLGSNLGFMLAPTLGGLLFNNYLNLAFAINGFAIAVSTVLIALKIKNVSRETDVSTESTYEADLDTGVSVFGYLKHNSVICLLILATGFANAVYAMFYYLMPIELTSVYADSGSVIYGTVTSVNCIEVVVLTALITRWFAKIRDGGKMIIGELLIMAGYVLFILGVTLPIMCYVSIIVFTFGEIFCTLSESPFLTRRIPASHRGRIIAFMNVFCSLFSSGLQLIIGEAYDNIGRTPSWLIVMGFGAVNILLIAVMLRFDKRKYKELYK